MAPDLPALGAFAGRVFLLAGPGAGAAPAGVLAQVSGPAAARARLFDRVLLHLSSARPAGSGVLATSRVPALAAAPGAQYALAGLVFQDPLPPNGITQWLLTPSIA
jgi:hypothetical protein